MGSNRSRVLIDAAVFDWVKSIVGAAPPRIKESRHRFLDNEGNEDRFYQHSPKFAPKWSHFKTFIRSISWIWIFKTVQMRLLFEMISLFIRLQMTISKSENFVFDNYLLLLCSYARSQLTCHSVAAIAVLEVWNCWLIFSCDCSCLYFFSFMTSRVQFDELFWGLFKLYWVLLSYWQIPEDSNN